MNKSIGYIFTICAIGVLVVYGCANRGYPEGGAKDETPPVVLNEVPASYSTGFSGKHVRVYFDEYIQLRDINNKLIVSPPMKKQPRVSNRGKYLQLEFQDTLRPESTYSIDFGDAIVDNNEGNPLGFYRYVFSTGPHIDSLELAGQLLDANTGLPVLGATVLLYENVPDSVLLKELPQYVARTDSSGMWRVTNIRETEYLVMAIEDAGRDNLYTPEQDKVAFLDTLVTPRMWKETRMDTLRPDTTEIAVKVSRRGKVDVARIDRDTVVEREYTIFGPINLNLVLFEEEPTQLYLLSDSRPEREKIELIFSVPGENGLKARLLTPLPDGSAPPDDWYFTERSPGNDTLFLWLRDTTISKIDSLSVELSYLATDTLKQRTIRTDTVRYNYRKRAATTQEDNQSGQVPVRSRRRRNDNADKPATEFLGLTLSVSGQQDLHLPITIEADKPLRSADLEKFVLEEKIDTLWVPAPYHISRDSLNVRKYYLESAWKPGTEYRLALDSMAVYSLYGLHNDAIEQTFKTKTPEDYGKIIVEIRGSVHPVLVQLYAGGKDIKVVSERWTDKDAKLLFDFLNEGTYYMRAVIDRNGNKKWDTGNFLQRIQPEEIKYHPVEIVLKKNFDIEQDFDVSRHYIREDPNKKKEEEKKNKNTR